MMQEAWERFPDAKEKWDEIASEYQWENGIPKNQVLIKLNPDISDEDRTFIANGVRQFFTSRTDMVFTKDLILKTINSVRVVLAMFVLIIAVISMSVAFFLLMIAMNQNIN